VLVPGINVGDNPELNLTWTAIGYDAQSRQYPEGQKWANVLKVEVRKRAANLDQAVGKLLTLRTITASPTAQQLSYQLKALVQNYAEGCLLHGPMLAYCYVCGDTFYSHSEPSGLSFLMPKSRLDQGEGYDCYEHVEVALSGVERLVTAFGCLEVPTVDVRGSTAVKPASSDFQQANLSKVSRFFGRCSMEDALNGYQVAYLIKDYLKMREYEYLYADRLPRNENQFFIDEGERVSLFVTGKWQYFWFCVNEHGNLVLYKIAGHKTYDGTFCPAPRPEHRRVTYNTFDGRPCLFIFLQIAKSGRSRWQGLRELILHTKRRIVHVCFPRQIGRPSLAST
jgi:hypothetical protein